MNKKINNKGHADTTCLIMLSNELASFSLSSTGDGLKCSADKLSGSTNSIEEELIPDFIKLLFNKL